MAGTEAKKIAPATNNRAQKGAARLTGRRSFHAQALSPCRRITPASPGSPAGDPAARWRHFYSMGFTFSLDDKRQLSRCLSLTCRPHKLPVNLALKGWFRQGTLGCLKRNFLGPAWRATGLGGDRRAGTAKVAKHCRGHALRFCLKSDAGAPIEAARPDMPGLAVPSERSNASDDDHRVVPFRPRGAGARRGGWRWPRRTSGASPVQDLAKYEGGGGQDDNYRHRMMVNLAALGDTVALAVAGVWLAIQIADMRKNQDCLLSGRRNCAPIDIKALER